MFAIHKWHTFFGFDLKPGCNFGNTMLAVKFFRKFIRYVSQVSQLIDRKSSSNCFSLRLPHISSSSGFIQLFQSLSAPFAQLRSGEKPGRTNVDLYVDGFIDGIAHFRKLILYVFVYSLRLLSRLFITSHFKLS